MAGGSRRRWLLGGAGVGLAGLGATAALAYKQAPRGFVTRAWEDMQRGVHPAPAAPHVKAWPDTGLHAAWIGHSTVLLKIDGFTILTDPVLGDRVGLHLGLMTLGIKRLVAPALTVPKLPQVDLVLLSHAHMDHFDIASLRRLEDRRTAVVTARETSDLLRVGRYRSVRELGWREEVRVGPVTLRAAQVNHWGARMRSDTYRGYNGYTIECGRYRVLFAGDTAETRLFRELKSSRQFDLAIMPIGAYNPWIRYHCTPEEAWRMGNDAGAEFFIPVHHRTFALSREPFNEPIERFYGAAGSRTERVAVDEIGKEFHLG